MTHFIDQSSLSSKFNFSVLQVVICIGSELDSDKLKKLDVINEEDKVDANEERKERHK